MGNSAVPWCRIAQVSETYLIFKNKLPKLPNLQDYTI